MYSLKRAEERKVKSGAEGQQAVAPRKFLKKNAGAQRAQISKPVAIPAQTKKVVEKQIEEKQEEEKVPAVVVSTEESDNDETEEERAHRKYVENILNADAAGRAQSDAISELATKEILQAGKAGKQAAQTRDLMGDYLVQMEEACDKLQRDVVMKVSVELMKPAPFMGR